MPNADRLAALMLAALLAGCAGRGGGMPAPAPTPTEAAAPVAAAPEIVATEAASTAVRSLLADARQQAARGAYGSAEATVERALELAPADGAVWYALAVLASRRGDHDQALLAAARARGLSVSPALERLAWQLTGRVHDERGEASAAADAYRRASDSTYR